MSRAGEYRQRIQIQQDAGTTQDAYGAPVENWQTVANPYAKVMPVRGNEELVNGQHKAETTHIVTVRYRDGITPKMRIKWGSRTLEILSAINEGERGIDLQMDCVERNI